MKVKCILSLLWTIFIFIGSIASGNTIDKIRWMNIPHFDKFIHFTWYFVLYTLWYSWFIETYPHALKLLYRAYIAIGIVFFGITMEILQSILACQRTFELIDIFINLFGTLTAILLFYPMYQNKYFGRFL